MRKPHLPKLRWEIDPGTRCPCGSGLAFRKCCRGNEELIGKAPEYYQKQDYETSEKAWRAELTRYIGWVFQHTLMLLRHTAGPPLELVEIDVGALNAFAERLAKVLDKQGKTEAILHTFDHLAMTIPLPGLKERMAYLKCLWLVQRFDDRKQANEILSAWPSHTKIQDYRLLQIYVEMRAESLSLMKRMEIAQRIIERTPDLVEKLQYSTAKTMVMILLGENDEAKKLHTEALNAFLPKAASVAEEGDLYPSFICARALEMQSMLTKDKIALDRALGFLEKVDQSQLSAEALSILFYQKGRMNWLKGDSLRAVECFSQSYEKNPGVLPLIYRLDEYVRLNELEKAKNDLATLRQTAIPEDYKLEFLRSASGLAVKTGDAIAARNIVMELKGLELDILNFRVQRDELCVELLEFVDEQIKKSTTPARRQTIWSRIQKVSEFFELKPNFCGLGLNLNRLFERKEKK